MAKSLVRAEDEDEPPLVLNWYDFWAEFGDCFMIDKITSREKCLKFFFEFSQFHKICFFFFYSHVFASNVTMHGFFHIFARHYSALRRFIWSLFFILSITVFIGQSSRRIAIFLSKPHATVIDEISNIELYFPSVTICNMNEVRFSQITQRDFYYVSRLLGFIEKDKDKNPLGANGPLKMPAFAKHESMKEITYNLTQLREGSQTWKNYCDNSIKQNPNLRQTSKEWRDYCEPPRNVNKTLVNRWIEQQRLSGNLLVNSTAWNMLEFYWRASHQLEDMLVSCSFQGEKCFASNFTTVFTRLGKCYTFNGPTNELGRDDKGNGIALTTEMKEKNKF